MYEHQILGSGNRSSLRIFTMIKSGSRLKCTRDSRLGVDIDLVCSTTCNFVEALLFNLRIKVTYEVSLVLSFRVIATSKNRRRENFIFNRGAVNMIRYMFYTTNCGNTSANEKMEIDLKIRVPCQFRGFNRVRSNAFQSCKQGNIMIIRVFEFVH